MGKNMSNGVLAKSGLAAIAVPDGWSPWAHAGRWLVISAPWALCTIDAETRCFRAGGYVTHGPVSPVSKRGTAGYTGRGWAADWEAIQAQNLEQIRLACVEAKRVVAAWGRHGSHLLQGKAVREYCAARSIKLHHLGLNGKCPGAAGMN